MQRHYIKTVHSLALLSIIFHHTVKSWYCTNQKGRLKLRLQPPRIQDDGGRSPQSSSMENQPTSPVNTAFQHASQEFAQLLKTSAANDGLQSNPQLINLELVKRAKKFDSLQDTFAKEELHTQTMLRYPNLQRIPGCVANVQVQTTLIPIVSTPSTDGGTQSFRVYVHGEADALISKGLLATLTDIFSSHSVQAQHILEVDPNTVADQIGLRSFLSAGRNDGLASMTKEIQEQIKYLLEQQPMKQQHIIIDPSTRSLQGNENPQQPPSQRKKPTVAMLLSGGVDSSVALHLLLRQNYNVTAFYLKIWLEDELAHLGQCPWEDDFHTCKSVCEHASHIYNCTVHLESISLQKEYKERVISYTIHEAKRGRTPNPDIMCNSRVKFGCFYDAIERWGFDYVATGHYAMLTSTESSGGHHAINQNRVMKLLRAPDPIKDQSYFLSALSQDQLRRVLFPVGYYHKSHVRALARDFDLPNKDRPDSQGLCFLGKVKFDEFLGAYLGYDPGDIIDAHTGEIIGKHNGIWFHTVGQRKGIGKVLFPNVTSCGPWYVVAKDPEKRLIFASNQYDEEIFTQARSEFEIEDIHWISGSPPSTLTDDKKREGRFLMKIRHGSTLLAGSLILHPESIHGRIFLDEKDKGLAPGQFVAIYSDDGECLGSGVISEQHWAEFCSKESKQCEVS